MVETIRDQLVKQYPDKKDSFTANADAYIAKLKKLDDSYTKSLSAAKQKTCNATRGFPLFGLGLWLESSLYFRFVTG